MPLDRVECAQCRMLVSTEDGAGEIVTTGDETRFYDDIGCLAAGWKAHHADATAFVHVTRGTWAEVTHAWYAQSADARTAMGSGWSAFASAEEARAADRAGRALVWNDVMTMNGGGR